MTSPIRLVERGHARRISGPEIQAMTADRVDAWQLARAEERAQREAEEQDAEDARRLEQSILALVLGAASVVGVVTGVSVADQLIACVIGLLGVAMAWRAMEVRE
jgi:divalent metal cation (Fe/Co/Zn/Cd) transporter